jgi:Type II secretory pathway, component PulF
MPLYSYEAFSKDGKKVTGVIDTSSMAAVRDQLARQGLYPIAISLTTQDAKLPYWKRMFSRGVSLKDKILFTKQLAVLVKSGVPLLQSLELLIDQFEGGFHSILVSIKDDVKGGTSLADAMQKYPKVFEAIYVQLVRAGEASGKLDDILMRLTDYLERREIINKKISGALQYPIIQMVIAFGVVIILLTAVVPQLQGLFDAQGENLPTSTRIMLGISELLKHYFLVVLIALIIIIAGIQYFKRTPTGRTFFDRLKLKLPVIKYVTRTSAVVQFSYTLGMLIESGVILAEALDIVVKIVDNQILADTLMQARDKIIKQGKIAQYLKQTNLFPPIAIYLIGTGEETGQLGAMLLTVAKNYEVELNELIDTATGLISPIMLVVMAIVVGFIIMSIAGPIMQGGQAFGLEGL